MKKITFAAAALVLSAGVANAQFDLTAIDSGSVLYTDADIDTALSGINTGSLDRNTGISLDSDGDTLVQLVRNGGSPFGDYLLRYNLATSTGPTNFGGDLDDLDAGDNDVRTGSGGIAISAGNGVALFYDFQNSGGEDELHSIGISNGTYSQIEESPDLSGLRIIEHVSGTNWVVGDQSAFGGDGTVVLYNTASPDITNATVLATGSDVANGGIFDIDIVDNGGTFDMYYVDSDQATIRRVTDVLGTPGAATDVTPSNLAAVSGLEIWDMLAIDSDTFIVFDGGNGNILAVDNNVVTTYSYSAIGTATGASNFTLDPFFIYDHLEKRIDGNGDLQILMTNNAAYTGSQAGTEPSIVSVIFAASTVTNVNDWTLYY